MINGERLLGALLKQGMRGRRRSGLDSLFGGPTKMVLGMGALGVAIAAFDHFTQGSSRAARPTGAPPPQPSGTTPPPPPPGTPGVSLDLPAPPAAERTAPLEGSGPTGDQLLLIRAMIAAANADGRIDDKETEKILNYLDEAGMSAEERGFIQNELASPVSIDSILPLVQSEELANQLYAVSLLAIEVDSKAEHDYLSYLRARLGIGDQTARELHRQLRPAQKNADSGDLKQ